MGEYHDIIEKENLMTKKNKELIPYTRDKVYESTLSYFKGDSLAADAWINKYSLKDSFGNIYELNPDEMHHRIAAELSRIENNYKNPLSYTEIYEVMKDFKYIIPQGSPMSGIGNNFQAVSLSNCFVVGIDGPSDSYGSIMKVDQEQVQLMKRRGGVGHDLSGLRPAGTPVNNSALTSTGVVPFMERYSNSTREVAQDGRRGALMLSISVEHPDAEAFIDAKLEQGKVTGANVSVRMTDDFMKAVKKETGFTQRFPISEHINYYPKLKEPIIVKEINAKPLWDKVIHNAWKSAEPGILFWDQIIRESLADRYTEFGYKTVSTNPCGEIPLCPDDSCRLIAINLYSYVINPFTKDAKFDFTLFKKHASIITRMMDNIIDLELEKIDIIIDKIKKDTENPDIKASELALWQRIKIKCENGRRTGIGVTAEGDMLAALGLRYGTPDATDFSRKVHRRYAIEVLRESVNLAKERGKFPIYSSKLEENHPFLNRIEKAEPELIADLKKYGRRHIAMLTIAPTGTTSLMSQTTSGIEPAFLVSYKRRRKINPNDKNSKTDFIDEVGDHWEEYHVFHHKFIVWLEVNGYSKEAVEKYSEEELQKLISKSPYHKAMANDVDWVEKVRMQGKIQQWVDHSISVTVNLPSTVDEKLVNDVYLTAWEEGCKGCTIYRDGSRSGVLISTTEKKLEDEFAEHHAPKRPKDLACKVYTFHNKGEKWVGFIGMLNNKPYEIFTGQLEDFPVPGYVTDGNIIKFKKGNESTYNFVYKDKLGNDITIPNLNTAFDKKFYDMAKTISAILRHGMPIHYVVELIEGLNLDGDLISTWKAGVKRMLKSFIKDGTVATDKIPDDCPNPEQKNCQLVYEEGCLNCKTCGKAKCG